MKKVLILGDSQSGCYGEALADAAFKKSLKSDFYVKMVSNGNIVQDFVLDLANGETILNPLVSTHFSPTLRQAKTFWKDNRVVFQFAGAEHNRYALLRRGTEFDFMLPGGAVDGRRPFVPLAAIRAFFERALAKFDKGLSVISKLAGPAGFHVLQGPPPVREGEMMTKFLDSYGGTRKFSEQVSALDFRLKVYELTSNVLEAIVVRNGGVFVRAPAAARDADGTLRPDMVRDPHHANGGYGRLFLSQLDAVLAK